MKPLLIAVGIAGLLLALVGSSLAQYRVYPIVELTDEDVARIDIKDGTIEDWLEVVGEPTVTALDFITDPDYAAYDPVDMDFRIWLAWHQNTNHIYVAVERVDDIYINEFDRAMISAVNGWMGANDSYTVLTRLYVYSGCKEGS